MSSVSISDFKITVKLDAKNASAGLKRLQKQLKQFSTSMASATNIQSKITDAVKGTGAGIDKNKSKQKGFLRGLKKTLVVSRKIRRTFASVGHFIGGLAFKAMAFLGVITAITAKITQMGMKMETASITMKAAVAGSDIGSALSPANLEKLQKQQLQFAQNLGKTYGMNTADTVSQYAKFYAASSKYLGVKGTEGLFDSFTQLGVVYGLSSEKMSRAMTAFTQMASKNQVMAEELKQQLGDVLPGSMEIFARAMTNMEKYGVVTVERLYDMMAKGKIVASEVLPYVTDEMYQMANAGNSIGLAMATTYRRFQIFKESLNIFGAGAYNQFSDELGVLIDKLTTVFQGKGLTISIGKRIADAISGITNALQPFFDKMEKFEEEWAKSSKLEQLKLADNVFMTIFDGLADSFTKALNSITVEDFRPLIDVLSQVFSTVINEVTGLSTARSFFEWTGLTGLVSDGFTAWDPMNLVGKLSSAPTTRGYVQRETTTNVTVSLPSNLSSDPSEAAMVTADLLEEKLINLGRQNLRSVSGNISSPISE